MKQRLAWLMTAFLLISILIPPASAFAVTGAAQTAPPEVTADAAILMDMATGEILYDKQMDKQKFPASTTKVMTALLTMELLKLTDHVIIDQETSFTEGSRIYLLEGEELTVEQLLSAMLIESANDAAVALAKKISGSVSDFAVLMNQRAKELGATNTQFSNPNGMPDETHLTTAHDLALIAREGMKHDTFRRIVTTYRYTIPATALQDTRYLYNSNRLLYDERHKVIYKGTQRPIKYDGITGIKTGYTIAAGSCLIASAKRGDSEFLAVVLQSEPNSLYLDVITLLEYGFDNYQTVSKMAAGETVGEVKVKDGTQGTIPVMAGTDVKATLLRNASAENLDVKVVLDDKLSAPLSKGDKAGEIQIYDGDVLLASFDAVVSQDVEKSVILSSLSIVGTILKYAALGILILVGILAAILIVLILRNQRLQEKRRRIRRAKRSGEVQQLTRVDLRRQGGRRV